MYIFILKLSVYYVYTRSVLLAPLALSRKRFFILFFFFFFYSILALFVFVIEKDTVRRPSLVASDSQVNLEQGLKRTFFPSHFVLPNSIYN